jgi:hypothetical protein
MRCNRGSIALPTIHDPRMLRGITRLTLHRGVHTTGPVNYVPGLSRHRVAMAAGASVIAVSYLGWRLSLESRGIVLDSDSACMDDFSLSSQILFGLNRSQLRQNPRHASRPLSPRKVFQRRIQTRPRRKQVIQERKTGCLRRKRRLLKVPLTP